MRLALLSTFLALPFAAHAQTVSAGAIYQAFAQNGGVYIQPSSGAAILTEKSSLNWKSILATALGTGSIAALTGGLSGVVAMSAGVEKALAVGHIVYDTEIQGILQSAVPSGLSNIAPVLSMTGSMTAGPTGCSNNSIFASAVRGITPTTTVKGQHSWTPPGPISISIGGLEVTFTPQGLQVLKNASGSRIKQFMVIDVLACVPTVTGPVQLAPPGIGTAKQPIFDSSPAISYDASPTDDPVVLARRLASIYAARAAALEAGAQFDREHPIVDLTKPTVPIRTAPEIRVEASPELHADKGLIYLSAVHILKAL